MLSDQHPEINKIDNGITYPIVGEERELLLDEWVVKVLELGFFNLRLKRDALLAKSDWTQNPDAPVDTKAWAVYRQELRDLPAKTQDPTTTIVWPTPPA